MRQSHFAAVAFAVLLGPGGASATPIAETATAMPCSWCASSLGGGGVPDYGGIVQHAPSVQLLEPIPSMSVQAMIVDDRQSVSVPLPHIDRTFVYLFGSLAVGATMRLVPLAFRPRAAMARRQDRTTEQGAEVRTLGMAGSAVRAS